MEIISAKKLIGKLTEEELISLELFFSNTNLNDSKKEELVNIFDQILEKKKTRSHQGGLNERGAP
jgi:hypothetical protein